MYYNARWYDPALGRFAQADSIVPPGVQGLDRYAYVDNSPMNYVDPSGHICVESDGDSDVGMAGNCHGGSNPKYKPGLQGSPSGWTGGGPKRSITKTDAIATIDMLANGVTVYYDIKRLQGKKPIWGLYQLHIGHENGSSFFDPLSWYDYATYER